MSIADFVADKMSGYATGGMSAGTAADFIRGELSAIYRRQHHSRDASGAWQTTPLPEKLDPITAMKKCDEAITEILNYCAECSKEKIPALETRNNPSVIEKKTGLEGLKNYARKPA
jgi:hypothetical protein